MKHRHQTKKTDSCFCFIILVTVFFYFCQFRCISNGYRISLGEGLTRSMQWSSPPAML